MGADMRKMRTVFFSPNIISALVNKHIQAICAFMFEPKYICVHEYICAGKFMGLVSLSSHLSHHSVLTILRV